MEKRITEQPSHYDHLETMSIEQLTAAINQENKSVPTAIDRALPQINALIAAILQRLQAGGRLFYCGCGFLLMGLIADGSNLVIPFLIPFFGYFIVLLFASELTRKHREVKV